MFIICMLSKHNICYHTQYRYVLGADVNKTVLGSGNQVRPGELSSQQNAAIVLPGSLFKRIINQPTVGAVFGVYESTNLFPVAGTDYNDTIVTEVGTQILSATVGNTSIHLDDLSEPVTVTLRLNINDSVSTMSYLYLLRYSVMHNNNYYDAYVTLY